MKLHFSVTAADFSLAGASSVAVKRELGKMGFPSAFIRRVAVAMYEGEVNMAIHAGGGEIAVEAAEGAVRVRMDDRGPGIPDVELAMREGFSTAPEAIQEMGFGAGMGMANMRRNCDEFAVEARPGGGTSVRMAFFCGAKEGV